MLVQTEVYSDLETARLKAFRLGVSDCLDDAFDLESGEPAVDLSLLSGDQATVQVKDISEETYRKLRAVAHLFSMSVDRAASVVLLLGLCHHYLELKTSAMFETDERFRIIAQQTGRESRIKNVQAAEEATVAPNARPGYIWGYIWI